MLGELNDPLILTAMFDVASQKRFQELRDRYYPAQLNKVPAHLTLFHKLPQAELPSLKTLLTSICCDEKPMLFESDGLRFLGKGVAIAVSASRLRSLHQRLTRAWQPMLSAQDRQAFKPHVTIQNKVSADQARATQQVLSVSGLPIAGTIMGLRLWFYRSGPWERCQNFSFSLT